MNPRKSCPDTPLAHSAFKIFSANDRMNHILIENLHSGLWCARPPGKIRPIVAIFTHMHNIRAKWLRLTAPHLKIPRLLSRTSCTPAQARAALAASAASCSQMLAEAYSTRGRMRKFHRDGWARPWPVGPEMLCYMISHEAHHRGQVCMLAHQFGFPLPGKVISQLWDWERLWKECGWQGELGRTVD